MARSAAESVESVQEGCRWLHNPPSGAQFADWFGSNVKIHDSLEHGDYVNGITLIPNTEKLKVTVERNGEHAIEEVERLSFSPYPQVETRIRYFWDWCAAQDLLGEIDILTVHRQHSQLPRGVFQSVVKSQDGRKEFIWLGAKCQVRAYERDVRFPRGRLVLDPPPATKTVPLFNRFGPDVNAAMKAETGAIGRALGFAGMLVIPGAGISTAEDMQELTSGSPPAAGGDIAPEAALPEPRTTEPLEEPTEDQGKVLRDLVNELAAELQKDHPDVWSDIQAWAKERGTDLENIPPAGLRPIERQLRRKLDAAKKAQGGAER